MSKFLGFLLGVVVALAGPAVFGVLDAPGGIELNAKEMALAYGIGALIFWTVVSYFSGAGALGAFVAFGTLVYCWLWIPNRTTNFLNDVPGVTTGMIEGSKQYTLNGVVPILTVISLVYGIQLIVHSAQRRRRERVEAERLQREQEAAQAQQEAEAAALYPVAGSTYPAEGGGYGGSYGDSSRYDDLFDEEPEPVRPRNQADEQTSQFPVSAPEQTAQFPGAEGSDNDARGNDYGDDTVLVPTDGDDTTQVPVGSDDSVRAQAGEPTPPAAEEQEQATVGAEEQTVAAAAGAEEQKPEQPPAVAPVAAEEQKSEQPAERQPQEPVAQADEQQTVAGADEQPTASAPVETGEQPTAVAPAAVEEPKAEQSAEPQPREPVATADEQPSGAGADEERTVVPRGGPGAQSASGAQAGSPTVASAKPDDEATVVAPVGVQEPEQAGEPRQEKKGADGGQQAVAAPVSEAKGQATPMVTEQAAPVVKEQAAPVVTGQASVGREQVGQQYRERMEDPEDTGEFFISAFENPTQVSIRPAGA